MSDKANKDDDVDVSFLSERGKKEVVLGLDSVVATYGMRERGH